MSTSRRRLIVAERICTADPSAPWVEAVVVEDGLITLLDARVLATLADGEVVFDDLD